MNRDAKESSFKIPLAIVICVCLVILISRLPTINYVEFSTFWPVTGVAVALGCSRFSYLVWVAIALFIWSYFFYEDFFSSFIFTSGLSGAAYYCYLNNANRSGHSDTNFFYEVKIKEYIPIGLIALLPSSLAGSLAYQIQQEQFVFVDIFLTYTMSELLGLLVFYPLTMIALELKNKELNLEPIKMLVVVALILVPVLLQELDLIVYSKAAIILVFPVFVLIASNLSRDGMVISCFLLVLISSFLYPAHIEGESIQEKVSGMLTITFWLISVLFTTQVLFQNIEDKKKLSRISRELELERAKSDRLLKNILPEDVAELLRDGSGTIAQDYPEVTVLFADIANFTPLSDKLSPKELVEFLNNIFTKFDLIAKKYDIEKIKTIGDAYMVVSGAPEYMPDHAKRIVKAALEINEVIQEFSDHEGKPVQIRIGIHSGPAVGGVIGVDKFAYDLWGDTVNVASRMESHGQVGKIQISEAVYDLIKNDFHTKYRGVVKVKGRGEMRTWWLVGQK
jgi:class 3 adenylate cyclase